MDGIWLSGTPECEKIEKCIKCNKFAEQICKYCGVFCHDHGIIHRHEMKSNDHATEQIGFDLIAFPWIE